MRCPTCELDFENPFDLTRGAHVEYVCICGQVLQWDHPIAPIASHALHIGLPQACDHTALRKLGALVPWP
jgi:hypothetical protein